MEADDQNNQAAPERIWASAGSYPNFDSDDWDNGSCCDDDDRGGTEYVRADIADRIIRELLAWAPPEEQASYQAEWDASK